MKRDAFHVPYLSNKIPEAVFHGQAVKTVAYLRVSTARQDVRSQRLAILEYARKHDFRIDDFIEATASGQASEKRRRLDELMHVLQRGDRLVVSELSRPARSLGRMGRMPALSGWRWHLDEVFVTISGERHYLWRAVDQEGKVLEAFVSKNRDRKAALKFLRKRMKRYPRPDAIITDRRSSYRAALREVGGSGLHQAGRWLNNRAENSHLPFRRREHAMRRFRRMRSLQKFATVHSVVYNHFNLGRPLCSRENFKLNRAAALARWRQLGAAKFPVFGGIAQTCDLTLTMPKPEHMLILDRYGPFWRTYCNWPPGLVRGRLQSVSCRPEEPTSGTASLVPTSWLT